MTTKLQRSAGFVLSGAFWAITLLHVYWAMGGTWALEESLGEGNPVPPAWLIWLVSSGLAIAAAGVLGQIGIWGRRIPAVVFQFGTWLLFVSLVGVAVLNVSTGRFWEVFVIAPFCGLLAALAFIVARVRRAV